MAKQIDFEQLKLQREKMVEAIGLIDDIFIIMEVNPSSDLSEHYKAKYVSDTYTAFLEVAKHIKQPSEWEVKQNNRHILLGESTNTRLHVGEILKSQNEHLKCTYHEVINKAQIEKAQAHY